MTVFTVDSVSVSSTKWWWPRYDSYIRPEHDLTFLSLHCRVSVEADFVKTINSHSCIRLVKTFYINHRMVSAWNHLTNLWIIGMSSLTGRILELRLTSSNINLFWPRFMPRFLLIVQLNSNELTEYKKSAFFDHLLNED